jgi:hypothetical protein
MARNRRSPTEIAVGAVFVCEIHLDMEPATFDEGVF